MAGTNEILTFAQGVGANVATQSAYAASGARVGGVTSGVADSQLYNKTSRQTAFLAAALSQWLVDTTGGSVLDNGDVANVKALLTGSVQAIANTLLTAAGFATIAQMNSGDNNLLSLLNAEIANRGAQASNLFNDYVARTGAEVTSRVAAVQSEANTRSYVDDLLWANFAGYMTLASVDYGTTPGGTYLSMPTKNGGRFLAQWNRVFIPTGAGDPVPFPVPFINGCSQIIASDFGAGVNICAGVIADGNKSGFNAYARPPTSTGQYTSCAFGYLAVGN